MSNLLGDSISNYIQDHEIDLLYEYLENERHWKEFTNWLYDNDQHEILEALFTHFIELGKGKEVEDFRTWVQQTVYEKMSASNEDNLREDR